MRIVALDLIRFFAALSVVFYHLISRPESMAFPVIREVTKFGYLGVPLFFMISGYVISLSAHNRNPIQFAISRFVRLYPALWACATFTMVILIILQGAHFSIQQILANFTLLNDYLGYEDIDGVYWTLKAELKFYGCVFLLLVFRVFNKYKIWLTVWLIMAYAFKLVGQPFFMGWFISPEYSSFFIAGVAFYLIQEHGKSSYNYAILIGSLVLSSYLSFQYTKDFIRDPSFLQELIAMVLVWSFYWVMYRLSIGKMQLKPRKSFVTLGALTYPLYLIHNLPGKAFIDSYSDIVSERILIVISVLAAIFFSWVIHVTVEKPFATPMKKYLLSLSDRVKNLVTTYRKSKIHLQ